MRKISHLDTRETRTILMNQTDVDRPSSDELPLLFYFDCASTGGSMYKDHIIEVGAQVVAVPNCVNITQHQYGSLMHSS